MNRFLYSARAVFLGLLTTQILATLQVYLSDLDLYQTVTTLSEAGYLAVPNQLVAPSLLQWGPAFCGAVFFTLSIGAGLSILWLVLAWIWDRLFERNCALIIPILFLWLAAPAAANWQGFSPMVTAHFLVTPLVVFASALHWMPKERDKKVWLRRLFHILPILLLTGIWTAQADKSLFLNIRDYLLLSNPMGKTVDEFYYRYTLYPAEVFKPLEQKLLKACRLEPMKNPTIARSIERALISYDYLPVPGDGPVPLEIAELGEVLVLRHGDETILQTTAKEFLSQQEKMLAYFSAAVDNHVFFRQATILCLLIGFPLILYLMVFSLIQFLCRFFVALTPASLIAGGISFLIGLALLAPLHIGRPKAVQVEDVAEALNASSWQQRVIGLRVVVEEGLEVGDLVAHEEMLESPHVPERYWLAKALGQSRNPQSYGDLLTLLDDPHPNVVSMAFEALGERGERWAIEEIKKRIKTSHHWYNQWYAYRALRELGWRQSRE
jgi:hypothetical protein